jgi:hypothetical protein
MFGLIFFVFIGTLIFLAQIKLTQKRKERRRGISEETEEIKAEVNKKYGLYVENVKAGDGSVRIEVVNGVPTIKVTGNAHVSNVTYNGKAIK